MDERNSELTAIGELLGQQRERYAWPPKELAPGVVLRRRKHTIRHRQTQEIEKTVTYLVPFVEDPRLLYASLALRNSRPEDAGNCPSCNGAGIVRYDRPVGSAAFAKTVVCPKWSGELKRCVEVEQKPKWYDR